MASNTQSCRWCGAVFLEITELTEHEDLHRNIDFLNGMKETCPHVTTTLSSQETCPPVITTLSTIKCEDCNKIYSTRSSLQRHKRGEHMNQTFDCSKCSKTFKYIANRNYHQKMCRGVEGSGDNTPLCLFSCDICGKNYSTRSNLIRHRRTKHPNNSFVCSKCPKIFRNGDDRRQHEKICSGGELACNKCQKRCSTVRGLRRHLDWHEKLAQRKQKSPITSPKTASPNSSPQYRCRRCIEIFPNRHDLYLHGMRQHFQIGGALQLRPWAENEDPPWVVGNDNALRDVYLSNEPLILEPHRLGPVGSIFNFPLTNDVSIDQLMRYADEIYRRQNRAFRLNVVFGVILQNRETGRYRYFVPYNNNGILERPLYVSRRTDLQSLRERLETMDITNELLRVRPDTKWIPVLVTNVHFTVYETYYPIGQGSLPDYLLKKNAIYPLVKDRQTGKPFKDQLCAFRCLALHRGHNIKSLEVPSYAYHRQWIDTYSKPFDGLSMEDFVDFEKLFEVNMEVYSLQEDGFAHSIFKSRGLQETTMYVNLYENHLSYIRDFSSYAQKYQCQSCDRHFNHAGHLHRHQRICGNKTKYVYPGGFHQTRESIFEQLDQFGINVPYDQRTYHWFACFDYEAILQKIEERSTPFLEWTQKHIPVSVSICSNVEDHTEPLCLVDDDSDRLIESMVTALNEISEKAYELANEKWGWVFDAIEEKIESESKKEECIDDDEYDDSFFEDEAKETSKEEKKSSHPLNRLYDEMEKYMLQVPVIGFNSAKYDLNLIKQCIAKHLNMHERVDTFVVKKENAYTCLATEQLKFLDMSQFLAPGSSYAGFLKAYHVEEQKGFFPYEWFDGFDKLEMRSLPQHEAFYSKLKGRNINIEDYQFCQKVWKELGMKTFKDFLVWYNNLDVGPFVQAVERFLKFFFDKGIDVFKTTISIPGTARQLLFKAAKEQGVNFALFDQNNADLYQTVKQNVVGGPSIIFTRHHRTDETLIRGKKKCKAILGFDANALYLQAIGQSMPVGPFVRRRADNEFRPELRDKYMSAYYWMDWIAHTHGMRIEHKLNTGREVRVGKYPVDGFAPAAGSHDSTTVFQFQGCYWHGHLCRITRAIKNEKWRTSRAQKYRKTQGITAYLKQQGHEVVEIWECQFQEYCRQNSNIYAFIDAMRPGFFQQQKGKTTENKILEGVIEGQLFGMVEVDIEVPQEWPSYYNHPSLSPREYFQEMSPLFCTTEIPFEAIGEHMQQHVREYAMSREPRRLLVGGMKAQQILLSTPLLQWYLRHGMIVTKIYQVVEYQQRRCFQEFVKEVSNARRQGDANPDTAIIADTMKVIGNSGFGSLIMDKTKHRKIEYIQGENETSLKVNDPNFRKLDCLDDEEQYYEVEMAKNTIKLDLPIQLGYFILQYAKVRMLEFYYDFMDRYVDRSDFEYCEMDTDSAYMAISGSCLDDVIKPDMLENYRHGLKDFCYDSDIEADACYHWFPRTCCQKHSKYDKRTPGLFKLEYQGHEMIGLCSKTYIVRKSKIVKPNSSRIAAHRILRRCMGLSRKRLLLKERRTNEYKFSSKGINKRNVTAPMTKFRYVIRTGRVQSGWNRGFRVRGNRIFTYNQERRGFAYFYCKRKVLEDGIHTDPLDITLCPLRRQEEEVSDRELLDMLEQNFEN